jgi:hypothetical protein
MENDRVATPREIIMLRFEPRTLGTMFKLVVEI